jgi:hypothetical protein
MVCICGSRYLNVQVFIFFLKRIESVGIEMMRFLALVSLTSERIPCRMITKSTVVLILPGAILLINNLKLLMN